MSTFNIFSIFSYEKLIKKIYELKVKYYNTQRYWNSAIILDTSYLRHPSFLSFKLLSGYIDNSYFEQFEKYMKDNSCEISLNFNQPHSIDDVGFSFKEIEKITRLKEYFINESTVDLTKDYINFKEFILQYEVRRNINCLDYFPELITFIKNIK
jgi:hypothetical protein